MGNEAHSGRHESIDELVDLVAEEVTSARICCLAFLDERWK